MKARRLDPEFYTDPYLADLPDDVRLFHVGLEFAADDQGVVADDPVFLNHELFPDQKPRPVAEMIDLLTAITVVNKVLTRMVAPSGERVLVLTGYAGSKPSRFGDPLTFMRLPVPSILERNALQSELGVSGKGIPMSVACAECGANGTLRFVAPVLGLDDLWGGAIVANRVEIVPVKGKVPILLCRACRKDTAYAAPTDAEPKPKTKVNAKDAVQLVFDTWVESAGKKSTTKLSGVRRTKIVNALKEYPLEEVLQAVQGWKNIPHNRGENDQGTVYNDIELLLRDAPHIERFRDAFRAGPVKLRGVRRAGGNIGNFGTDSSKSKVKDDLR